MQFLPGDIEYLLSGNARQRKAYEAIHEIGLLEKLSKYSPILAGTIPLDIDTESSDLDIICESPDLKEFSAKVNSYFGKLPAFECYERTIRKEPTVVARFKAATFEFELFCQSVSVFKQYGILHLQIEARLLKIGGTQATEAIRNLKKSGLKTEPAFAKYFGIEGDPYDELAKMASFSDQELLQISSSAKTKKPR